MVKFFARAKNWLLCHKALSITFVLALVLDRVSKDWALMVLPWNTIELARWFHLRYVENTGAAFGILQNGNWVLIIVTCGIVVYLLKNWKELTAGGPVAQWALMLILAGALGNLYDRIALGFVVDFFDLRVWPVFNVADSLITVGGALLVLSLLTSRKTAEGK